MMTLLLWSAKLFSNIKTFRPFWIAPVQSKLTSSTSEIMTMKSFDNSVDTLSSIKTSNSAVKKRIIMTKIKIIHKLKFQRCPTLAPLQVWISPLAWPRNSKSITYSKTGLKIKGA
jgi:hypothetical protein